MEPLCLSGTATQACKHLSSPTLLCRRFEMNPSACKKRCCFPAMSRRQSTAFPNPFRATWVASLHCSSKLMSSCFCIPSMRCHIAGLMPERGTKPLCLINAGFFSKNLQQAGSTLLLESSRVLHAEDAEVPAEECAEDGHIDSKPVVMSSGLVEPNFGNFH